MIKQWLRHGPGSHLEMRDCNIFVECYRGFVQGTMEGLGASLNMISDGQERLPRWIISRQTIKWCKNYLENGRSQDGTCAKAYSWECLQDES